MLKKSSTSAEIKLFKLDYEAVMEELKKYGEKVIARGAKAVILIGSLARGDYTAFSDTDLIILSNNVPERPIDRLKEFIDPTLPLDVDVRVYTVEEFMKMVEEGRKNN